MGNGLQYTFNERDNRALGRLHWEAWFRRYFGLGVLFIIIITTFTTLDILPRRDVSAHFGGTGMGKDWDMAFFWEGMAFGLFLF